MKKKKLLTIILSTTLAATTLFSLSTPVNISAAINETAITTNYTTPTEWQKRHSFSDYETILTNLNNSYSNLTTLESFGKSYQNRDLWCLTITDKSVSNDSKTGIGVFANIHGAERESGESALYTACWFLENSNDPKVKEILQKHIIYVIPIINPDAYVASDVSYTRSDLHPVDKNGDGIPSNDPYEDLDGNGYIDDIYVATGQNDSDPWSVITGHVGYESKDSDNNGHMGDDPLESNNDLNRNFDYVWGQDGTLDTEGTSPASELETKAVQDFIDNHQFDALCSLHTGIQTVLYPWCYRPTDESNAAEKADIDFMASAAEKMRKAAETTTHRNFYAKQSYDDYPTYSELIDYSYGKYGIHSYTIEVYCPGSSDKSTYDPNHDPSDDSVCYWNEDYSQNETYKYYTLDELTAMGIDINKILVGDDSTKTLAQAATEDGVKGAYFVTYAWNTRNKHVPEDQDVMVDGIKDSILQMIYSEGKVEDPAVEANYSALQNAVDIADATDLSKYEENAAFLDTLAKAKDLLAKKFATQEEVDAMTLQLNTSISSLVPITQSPTTDNTDDNGNTTKNTTTITPTSNKKAGTAKTADSLPIIGTLIGLIISFLAVVLNVYKKLREQQNI